MKLIYAILYALTFIFMPRDIPGVVRFGTPKHKIPCCDSPDKDKCDQCQEVGLANPLNH